MNRIILGENLTVLRTLPAQTAELIYVDPPFNTGRRQARPRLKTVRDEAGDRIGFGGARYRTVRAPEPLAGYADRFDDYLGFLRPRLMEAHRLLTPTGSLFVHLDPREVHYVKVMLDEIFGRACFQNEIIWAYDYGARASKRWPAKHDNILWYTRDPERYTFTLEATDRIPYMAPTLVGPVKAARGKTPTDVWWHTIVSPTGKEKTGYATQKPLGILERLVRVHSRPGERLLDFFAGSGTAGLAAQRNGREFLLIDESPEAVAVMEARLELKAETLGKCGFLSGLVSERLGAMSLATMQTMLTRRIGRIEVSATLAVTAEALRMKAAGIDLADFGAGEPHFETPRHIKDAAIEAINAGYTRYTNVAGTPEVRKALCARHAADFGTDYAPEECVFTTGGKLALFNCLQVLCEHGDEVILPVPYWVSYKDIIQYADGVVKLVESDEREDFRVTAAMMEAAMTDRTKVIILCSPSNPSGAVMAPDHIRAIVRLAHERGVYVLLDECYVYLTFEGQPFSGASDASAREHVIVLGSLSKTYAMTGWRAGFALGPKPIIAAMAKLQSQSTSNAATFVQRAAIAAVSGDQACVREMRAEYIQLRDRVLEGFKTIPGLTCTVPQGAFYVYPNVSAFMRDGSTADDIAARLLSEAHVVVVPGEAFGTAEHIRLSYAVSADVIDKGVERMRTFFAGLSGAAH